VTKNSKVLTVAQP